MSKYGFIRRASRGGERRKEGRRGRGEVGCHYREEKTVKNSEYRVE
jgi:hypothetical protein